MAFISGIVGHLQLGKHVRNAGGVSLRQLHFPTFIPNFITLQISSCQFQTIHLKT